MRPEPSRMVLLIHKAYRYLKFGSSLSSLRALRNCSDKLMLLLSDLRQQTFCLATIYMFGSGTSDMYKCQFKTRLVLSLELSSQCHLKLHLRSYQNAHLERILQISIFKRQKQTSPDPSPKCTLLRTKLRLLRVGYWYRINRAVYFRPLYYFYKVSSGLLCCVAGSVVDG